MALRTGRGPTREAVPLTLTEQERALFATLRRFVAAQGLPTTLRVAGGWVRDKLLGGPMARVDIDLAVDAPSGTAFAKRLRSWLRGEGDGARAAGGGRAARVGVIQRCPARAKHLETARLSVFGLTLDVVSLRTEAYAAGSRIPAVAGGTPREDAFRRDLTINALFYNVTERTVEDWTGRGVADLRRRLVRTPLPPRTTLLDDPLRALRAVRFAARLHFDVDAALAAAARDPGVQRAFAAKISRERVAAELDAILTAPSAVRGVGLLAQLGLLPLVLPSAVAAADEAGGGQSAGGEVVVGADHGSRAVTAASAGAAATAATGALASLEALRLANFGGLAAAGAAFSPEEVRLARYAALTLPLARRAAVAASGGDTPSRTRAATGRERRLPSAIAAALREELRMASRDVAAVVRVHEAAAAFRALATAAHPPAALFRPADRLGTDMDPQTPARAPPPPGRRRGRAPGAGPRHPRRGPPLAGVAANRRRRGPAARRGGGQRPRRRLHARRGARRGRRHRPPGACVRAVGATHPRRGRRRRRGRAAAARRQSRGGGVAAAAAGAPCGGDPRAAGAVAAGAPDAVG